MRQYSSRPANPHVAFDVMVAFAAAFTIGGHAPALAELGLVIPTRRRSAEINTTILILQISYNKLKYLFINLSKTKI